MRRYWRYIIKSIFWILLVIVGLTLLYRLENDGSKFCQNCGAKKPEGAPLYRCDKCGWEPEDPSNPPKFCPECGDIFDDSDKK